MTDELYHHGVKGMKWGIRRYQNEDGSLTSAGKRKYLVNEGRDAVERLGITTQSSQASASERGMSTQKKVAIGAAVTAGIMATGLGAVKVNRMLNSRITSAYIAKAKPFITNARVKRMQIDTFRINNIRRDNTEDWISKATQEIISDTIVGQDYLNKAKLGKYSAKEKYKYLRKKL